MELEVEIGRFVAIVFSFSHFKKIIVKWRKTFILQNLRIQKQDLKPQSKLILSWPFLSN